MKVYKLKAGYIYHPEKTTAWETVKLPVEEAIKQLTGKTTFMLTWEEDETLYSLTLPSHTDTDQLAIKTANECVKKIKEMFSK